MKTSTKFLISISLFITLSLPGYQNLQAQSDKKVLGIEDVKLWRTNSVTLSDNGAWYTVLYSLIEKPDAKEDTTKENSVKSMVNDYYGKDNQTDVLYIYNAKNGLKYELADASNPKFSSASDWVAYQVKPKTKNKDKEKTIIELRNLESGYTVQYESKADYSFTEDKNFFISYGDNGLLIYDLDNRREQYIANIGEYLIDKKSDFIAYTIASKDKRGNGIYLYKPEDMTTRAIQTGNFIFSNLSWNSNKTALAAYKYNKIDKQVDYANMCILVISKIDSETPESFEYQLKDLQGMPENMGPAVKFERYANEITWSNDGARLFIKIKEYDQPAKKNGKGVKENKDEATVDVWFWKDKKLLSQRMTEKERFKNEVYDALFFRASKKIVRLTANEFQRLNRSEGTDNWAILMDNSKYVSDWDVFKNDLYRIDLTTGDKKLIEENYPGNFEMSPDGEKIILWDGADYWCYDLKNDSKENISTGVPVSFVNKENDHYGFIPDYGFVGWVKKENAVIVNHDLDLWLLPLDNKAKAKNLTTSVTSKESIRLRFDDLSFTWKPEIDKRYIDLSSPYLLYAFNTKTKYAGYYQLQKGKLKKLIYGPESFSRSRRGSGLIKAEKSDIMIYKTGNYQQYPEAYLSDVDFTHSKKITNTNPQQEAYHWGERILIDYTNDDGVSLQGVLSIPDTYQKGQKLPMMVYSYEKLSQSMYEYSSPYLSGSSICEMMYVSDGYLFLRPDIHFNVGTPHSDMHECIDAAIRKVIELGYVDEKHIGYEGFSYGGHTGMFISTQDNKFAAIAAGAGVSNLVQGFSIDIVGDGSNEQDYYMTQQGRLGTDYTSNPKMYLRESAVFNAQNMNTPLLLFHGTADNVVQWEHSFGFYSILRYLKKPVVFLSYKGEGHGLRKFANRVDIQTRLKEFFDHYLKGKAAEAWMIEEIPYKPKEKTKEDEKNKRTVPIWR